MKARELIETCRKSDWYEIRVDDLQCRIARTESGVYQMPEHEE